MKGRDKEISGLIGIICLYIAGAVVSLLASIFIHNIFLFMLGWFCGMLYIICTLKSHLERMKYMEEKYGK